MILENRVNYRAEMPKILNKSMHVTIQKGTVMAFVLVSGDQGV